MPKMDGRLQRSKVWLGFESLIFLFMVCLPTSGRKGGREVFRFGNIGLGKGVCEYVRFICTRCLAKYFHHFAF